MVFERRLACLRIASGKAVLLAYETLRGVVAMFMAGFRSMVRILTRNGLFPLFLVLLSAYFALPSIIPGRRVRSHSRRRASR